MQFSLSLSDSIFVQREKTFVNETEGWTQLINSGVLWKVLGAFSEIVGNAEQNQPSITAIILCCCLIIQEGLEEPVGPLPNYSSGRSCTQYSWLWRGAKGLCSLSFKEN